MKTWFTSDQHFGHAKVIDYCQRPFANVEVMNEEIVRRFNEHVSSTDVTYHLGDFSLHQRELKRLAFMNGTHHLVAGNHDKCHFLFEKEERFIREYKAAGFATITTESEVDLGRGLRVHLCHLPFDGDHYGDSIRYKDFRPRDRGLWLLHGHVHNAWKVRERMFNVGVDQWNFTPVAAETVKRIIEGADADNFRL